MSATFTSTREGHQAGNEPALVRLREIPGKVVSCSTDGALWIWTEKVFADDENPVVHEVADASHSAFMWKGDSFYLAVTETDVVTACEKRCVNRYNGSTMKLEKTVLTFPLDVNDLDVSENFILVSCIDCSIKKASLQNPTKYDKIELDPQPLSVSIDPKEEFCAVSCSDGCLRVYPIEGDKELSCVYSLFKKFGDMSPSTTRAEVKWSPDGQYIFVAAQGRVEMISRHLWEVAEQFQDQRHPSDLYSVLCISKSGKFLAAGSLTGLITVWNIETRELVTSVEKTPKHKPVAVCSLLFSEDENDLWVAYVDETICILRNATACSTEEPEPADSEVVSAEADEDDAPRRKNRVILDEADEDETTQDSVDIGKIKARYECFNDLDHENEAFREQKYEPFPPVSVETFKPPTLPRYFISGGVAEKSADGTKVRERFLKWNRFGVVRLLDTQAGSTIEVQFHDASISSERSINNDESHYSLADLSANTIGLASKQRGSSASEIYIINVGSWDRAQKEWHTALPTNDSVIDILVSNEYVVVVTEQNNLRVFSLLGVQLQIVSFAGYPVTAAINNNKVLLACISSGPQWIKQDGKAVSSFSYEIQEFVLHSRDWYTSTSSNWSQTLNLPVGKQGNSLLWLSITDNGNPVCMDSSGCFRILAKSGVWMPIFDASPRIMAKSDAFWPFAVIEYPKYEIRYLYCRGSKYPLLNLRHTPSTIPISLPLCDMENQKSKFEHDILLNSLKIALGVSDSGPCEKQRSQALLQLFALTLKQEREGRAVELAGLTNSIHDVQKMIKYAAQHRKSLVVDKLNVLVNAFEEDVLRQVETSKVAKDVAADTTTRSFRLKKRESLLLPSTLASSFAEPSVDESTMEFESQSSKPEFLETLEYIDLLKGKNPFEASYQLVKESSRPLGEILELAAERKRPFVTEKTETRVKQAKLSLSKENATPSRQTAYDLWLCENEDRLRQDFAGFDEDFAKFCAQSFKMLPTAMKKEWKSRAEAANS